MTQWKLVFLLLMLVIITIWLAIFASKSTSRNLQVVACDVGQGDAFLIQEGKYQLLVDGGEGSRVLDCLSKYIPFWDRTIEAVVLTHPQADHYEGLIEVVRRYKVKYLLASEYDNSAQGFQLLKKEVGVANIEVINPNPSRDIQLGMIYIDILFPSASTDPTIDNVLGSTTTKDNLNLLSVVFELRYKDFEMLFTGDIEPEVIDSVIGSGVNDIDVLKVPHHGSKNGLTEGLLEASTPELAVISAGKKNRFGHPHQEILDLLNRSSTKVLRTDELGDVVIYSDGEKIWY